MTSSVLFGLPKNFYFFWLTLFVAKIAIFSFLPSVDDEAYYWVWGQNLALSYFDHPGLVGWINGFGLSPSIFRLPFITANQLSGLILCILGVRHFGFDLRKSILTVSLFNLIPVTGLGGCLALPDSFLILFWILSAYLTLNLIENLDDYKSALMLGLVLGLGFLSKYHMVLFALGLIIFSIFYYRQIFFRRQILLSIISTGFICILPVLIWNYSNEWISFLFQINHGLGKVDFTFHQVFEYFGGQLLISSPLLFLGIALTKGKSLKDKFLLVFTLTPFLFFFMSSLRAPVEANWPAIGIPSGIILLVGYHEKLSKYAVFYFLAAYSLIFVAGILNPTRLPEKAMEPFEIKKVSELTKDESPLYGATYQIASQLWLNQNRPILKPAGVSRFDMFDLWKQEPLPDQFKIVYKTSSGVPWVSGYRPVTSSNQNLGLYSLIEMGKK